ncbi:MAG: dienelactone hydrolase family protein [Acidobacteriota bacterium]|nr:dienelactone hydrolase family protein [Acidobacteriota bacterium]
MTRRGMFGLMGNSAITGALASLPAGNASGKPLHQAPSPPAPVQLPGTEPLTREGDLAAQMVEGIHRYLARQTAASVQKREAHWNRDYSSRTAYEASVAPQRERFRQIIGLIDPRVPFLAPELEITVGGPSLVAAGDGYKVLSVRWPVLEGVDAEGLLLEPAGTPLARVVALPDADWSPEMLAGLAPGVPAEAQFARRLAEQGCLVLIPTLINRACTWSGNEKIGKLTNETHREYIYRMTFEIGRHIIGYEVQKVLAAVDWFSQCQPARLIGVMGYGEGGLLALYSAAADTRIGAACVSGYFQTREGLWQEPVYRNVWCLLEAYGDAELAGLIVPRTLTIEAARGPEVPAQPPATDGRLDSAAPGRIVSPLLSDVQAEAKRGMPFFEKLGAAEHLRCIASGDGQGQPGSAEALETFLKGLGARGGMKPSGREPRDMRVGFDPVARLHRQFNQLVNFTQRVVMQCESVREKFWAKADSSSIENWQQSTEYYRRYLWEECFGKLPAPSEPLVTQTRKIYDEITWAGYEVLIPFWPEVFAYGILLLPKSMKEGERRPVVVCQHGSEGRPQHLIQPDNVPALGYYRRYAADLADHGFIVYCPQNPYIGHQTFQILQRLANPLKLSLFSFILSQHERTLDWLTTLPYVDASRIGFYGLSYGGKTAARVPPILERYALSICSADFNEGVWEICRDDVPWTFLFDEEYSILTYNLGNTFNYSEMANLMTPRPYMVERGHDDGPGLDPWVAYEYAKVQRHYDKMGLSERTRIEYFNGGHTLHGVGTFEFLHHFLDWGEPR